MRTARPESWPERLAKWRGGVRERAGGTRREPPAPATQTLTFFTKHETRITAFYAFPESRNTPFTALRFAEGAPCGEKAELKVAEPKTEIRRPDRRARRPVTTSLRMLMGPFLNILGLLPRDNVSLPPDYVFWPPDYDFFRIFTILPPGILRISPPSRCPRAVRRSRSASRRAPSAAAPAGLRAASAASVAT